MNNSRSVILLVLLLLMGGGLCHAQKADGQHIEKRYNIFFRINSSKVESDFQNNARTLETIRQDVTTTLQQDGAVPDSLVIISSASPDGGYEFNKLLAHNRAANTRKTILEMFPQFQNATIRIVCLDEDWDGLLQVLKAHPEFPQREEMMAVILDDKDVQSKEQRLRALKQGWRHLINNHIHALRNSSITLSVVMTATNADDEFVREKPQQRPETLPAIQYSYAPAFEQSLSDIGQAPVQEPKYRKSIIAARSNLLIPGMNIGLEIPIGSHWSIGLDYFYPWFVSGKNRWCGEMLGWFVDAKYWFPGKQSAWAPASKLKGHAVGVYAGIGYYDYQNKAKGAQGEYLDLGIDYTYSLPIANDKLRLEFNLGIGYIYTLYRPYYPSSDYEDLIKEPGIKFRSTNFIGPTRAGVSLVYPITVPTKQNPYIKMAERAQRKEARKNKKEGGNK
jgi:hypothetical protein